MNILNINKFHYMRGGCETVYFETAKILESHGHKSIFFSMQHPENLSCENRDYFMSYVELNTNSNSVINKLKNTGRILYSLKAKKLLSKLLNEYPVDIAHLHNIYHQISPSILHTLKKRNIPVVMTLHDYKMVCASYLMMVNGKNCDACSGGYYLSVIKNKCVKRSLAKSCLSAFEMYVHHSIIGIYDNVDAFISPSLFLKEKLVEMGFRKKIIHLPNFVDMKKFGNGKGGENSRENAIVYFGRLVPEKGLYTLIKATKLLDTIRNVVVKIIGDGPIRGDLEEKAKLGGNHNIQFLGYMKGEELYKEIKKCMAVVLPSEWYENNPMSVLEAFALGMPVIGAKIGGIPELVKDGITGLTFESGNAHELAEKIRYVLDNPGKTVKMGENARVFVEQNLNAEKYYQGLINIYQSAIGKY
ncbi:glycosyltransferase family 4 protein [Candidatus Kuenenia sp.]|uniref:glycosyltransferase family 4 protein n=1 Tax=Candidatus Kuenenia sp. TaxID=2499824 RepID=UPI00321FE0E9